MIRSLKALTTKSKVPSNPEQKKSLDRRESPRLEATIYVRLPSDDTLVPCRADLGLGGFSFESQEEIRPGAIVDLLFRLAGSGEWIGARGEILDMAPGRSKHRARGRFLNLAFEEERLIARWLDGQDLNELNFCVC